MKLFEKIHIGKLLRNHFSTLKDNSTKKAGFDDYLTFLILPLIIASTLVYLKIELKDSAINIIITTLSILVGLLFNVIVLIFDIIKRDATHKLKNVILRELLANISYTILLSICSILFTIVTYIDVHCIKLVATGLVYFLLSHFLVTVLMVLKRMYLLFNNEIDEIEKDSQNGDNS